MAGEPPRWAATSRDGTSAPQEKRMGCRVKSAPLGTWTEYRVAATWALRASPRGLPESEGGDLGPVSHPAHWGRNATGGRDPHKGRHRKQVTMEFLGGIARLGMYLFALGMFFSLFTGNWGAAGACFLMGTVSTGIAAMCGQDIS